MAKKRNHYDLKDIEVFVRVGEYPKTIAGWGEKSNFKRACKNFLIKDGQLLNSYNASINIT